MISKQAVVANSAGIHIRPSTQIFKYISSYDGEVTLEAKGQTLKIASMLQLLMLALVKGDTVTIRVSGPDEEKVSDELVELFEKHYDFK